MSTVVQEMLERNVGKVKDDESVLAELLFGSETRSEELSARWVSGLGSAKPYSYRS